MLARLPHRRTSPRRAAFSLVELLVVIAIMAILAGISYALLGQSGQAAREAATKSGILAIHSALEDRMRGFDRITQQLALADPDLPMKPELREFRKRTQDFMTLYNGAGNTPAAVATVTPAEAEIYVRKALFKAAFPQREEDLWGVDGVSDFDPTDSVPPVGGAYVDDSPTLSRMWASTDWDPESWKGRDKAARKQLPIDTTDDDLAESAELLYLTLTEGDVFGSSPMNLDGLDQNLIGDTDGDDNLELLDGWGKPLQFYNWPTRLFKADGVTYTKTDYPQASILVSGLPRAVLPTPPTPTTAELAQVALMNRDPMDNASQLTRMRDRRSLSDPMTYPPPIQQYRMYNSDFNLSGRTNPGRALDSNWFHDRDCYYVTLIVSAGPDGALGMSLPNAATTATEHHLGRVTNPEELADNLSNRQKGPR